MISSALLTASPIVNASPTTRQSSLRRRPSVVCFNDLNPRGGIGDAVLTSSSNLKLKKSGVKKIEELEENGIGRSEVGFKKMISFCGLGYWVCGFRCFPWLALNIHMAQNLNMHPCTLQLVQHSANLPMVAKPLYGVISDALYIGGAHRIPYVCIGGILLLSFTSMIVWLFVAVIVGFKLQFVPYNSKWGFT